MAHSSNSNTHSSNKENRLVTAAFENPKDARRAYESAVNRKGYSNEDVNVLMSDETRNRHFATEDTDEVKEGNKAAEGAGVGAATGGTIGGIAGALLAAGGTIALPGIGLAIAGPIAATLAGAGAGGASGTLVGALIGAGIPEKRAKRYESTINEGGIVLGVEPKSPEDERYFKNEWKSHNGQHIHTPSLTTEH
jgi:hypothetical protein